ncbi:F0F1 ATP synthase subunit epsilon [Amylibacter sp. SFDW26]|uniref:F0F1 ATP synthase subunit epsilon n=1 Tax=Amylibacter sp. SFDW26 TaxID=2652722 RepID=UPI0012622483|nr:F0F1 ATP synthase subunit epsilon [Amylibacter sp. SFDW26]KAB7610453.1 F0F1 ATP synthase subunit epsilon [Amylibacter sp. SFDW26]
MATIQFDLVSPERKLASVEASEIQIPGADGDFTAMADHAPFLTTLRPGILTVKAGSDVTEYVVTGGFVEITGEAASVLAEEAMPKSEVTADIVNGLVEAATVAAEGLENDAKDTADKRVSDTKALLDLI